MLITYAWIWGSNIRKKFLKYALYSIMLNAYRQLEAFVTTPIFVFFCTFTQNFHLFPNLAGLCFLTEHMHSHEIKLSRSAWILNLNFHKFHNFSWTVLLINIIGMGQA